MSLTFSLVCKQAKLKLWVGQGHHIEREDGTHPPVMTSFYTGDPEVMKKLHRFLQATQGKNLMLVVNDHQDDNSKFYKYKEFE